MSGDLNPNTAPKAVDIRDVIAERITALSRPINALQQLLERHADLPGHVSAQAFIQAWGETVNAFADFLQADHEEALAREAALREALNFVPASAAN